MEGGAAPGGAGGERAGRRAPLPPGAGGVPGGAGQGRPAGTRRALAPVRARAGAPMGWAESGNSQPLVLGLQLPVHGQREAEEAPGVPGFLDHIVLAGVQVEGGAEPRQEPRRQVEQPQPPRGRHGPAHREGSGKLRGRPALRAAFEAAAPLPPRPPRSPLAAAPGPTPGTSRALRPAAPPRGQLPTTE